MLHTLAFYLFSQLVALASSGSEDGVETKAGKVRVLTTPEGFIRC